MTAVQETLTPGVAHAAKALAEAIQLSPAWKEWGQACARFESDPELREALAQLQQLSVELGVLLLPARLWGARASGHAVLVLCCRGEGV